MAKKPKSGRPKLGAKKDLLIHSYDLFLVSQARLFTLAHYAYQFENHEIETRQRLLLFDDLLSFAITARRLIELTGLRSFANAQRVPIMRADGRKPPGLQKTQMGFLTIINCVIHCRFVELITNKFKVPDPSVASEAELAKYFETFVETVRDNNWRQYSVDPAIIIIPDEHPMFVALLKDIVAVSSEVAEKITDVCSQSKIFLEFEYRGG
jgi:hypothetical protein